MAAQAGGTVSDAAANGGFWNRPVRPRALIAASGVVLLVWGLLSALGWWAVYAFWEIHLTLRDQPVSLRLAPGLQARAEIDMPIQTHLDWHPTFKVPVKQVLNLRMQDALMAQVALRTHLPVSAVIEVNHVVPLQTQVNMNLRLRSWLPEVPVSLPVTVQLPVRMQVPVKADLPLNLSLQVSGEWPDQLVVPIDTAFDVRTHLQTPITVRLTRRTVFEMLGPVDPMALRIAEAHVRLPFDLFLRSVASRNE